MRVERTGQIRGVGMTCSTQLCVLQASYNVAQAEFGGNG